MQTNKVFRHSDDILSFTSPYMFRDLVTLSSQVTDIFTIFIYILEKELSTRHVMK